MHLGLWLIVGSKRKEIVLDAILINMLRQCRANFPLSVEDKFENERLLHIRDKLFGKFKWVDEAVLASIHRNLFFPVPMAASKLDFLWSILPIINRPFYAECRRWWLFWAYRSWRSARCYIVFMIRAIWQRADFRASGNFYRSRQTILEASKAIQ